MKLTNEDYLKKALLDTQERIRDFMSYSDRVEDDDLHHFFRECAETEGLQAQWMQEYLTAKYE